MKDLILQGDCLEKLKVLEDNSVDLICTDPPYGYSFMGKDWDKAVPSVDIWKECLRVLKPGAFALVMSAPRQDVLSQMIVRIGEAGFNTDFTSLYWTYASGFPKAMNIGKKVDKRMGTPRERVEGGVGTDEGYSGGFKPNEAQSNEAKLLNGSYGGFQPKPAVEIIIVAMKPLSEKSYVDQALKNGKGITWLDNCRIPTNGETLDAGGRGKHGRGDGYGFEPTGGVEIDQTKGRFPANLLVGDDALNDGQTRKASATKRNRATIGSFGMPNDVTPEYGDSGSYSRYFDLDAWAKTLPFLIVPKASKSEKNRGLEEFEEKQVVGGGGGIGDYLEDVNSASGKYGSEKAPGKNFHPTVKPLKLMSYLITLGSREGEIVLDPFCGSGTTCLAAKELKRNYIGIEREAEYVEIAKARLEAIPNSLF